jgi:hypothetical protein
LTTSRKRRANGWAVRLGSAAATAALLGAGATRALAGSVLQPGAAGPDSAYASLRVETIPSGLIVLVDGVRAGRSPVGPLWLPAKPARVQALSEDPRRFDTGRDAALVPLAPGRDTTIVLDLRPSVLLRTVPEPALLTLRDRTVGAEDRDTILGETPLRIIPGRVERRALRLEADDHADTTLAADALLAMAAAGGGGPVTIALRRVNLSAPAPADGRKPPLLRRRWVQYALIGVGAALTGSAAILRREGDRWYERYLSSSDPEEIPGLYDKTIRYDRLAAGALGAGQVAITAGLFLLVTGASR